jgi:hypothetical protein
MTLHSQICRGNPGCFFAGFACPFFASNTGLAGLKCLRKLPFWRSECPATPERDGLEVSKTLSVD